MADPTKEGTLVQSMVRGNNQFDGPESLQLAPDEHERQDGQAVEQQAHQRPWGGLRPSPEPFSERTTVEQRMGRCQEMTRTLPVFSGTLGFQRLFMALGNSNAPDSQQRCTKEQEK